MKYPSDADVAKFYQIHNLALQSAIRDALGAFRSTGGMSGGAVEILVIVTDGLGSVGCGTAGDLLLPVTPS